MTNKKLWLSLLAVVLIVCMLSIGLFACKKKNTEDTAAKSAEAVNAIINGLKKGLESGNMTDLKVNANLNLKVGEEDEYNLRLAMELDLLQFEDYYYKKAKDAGAFDSNGEYFTGKNWAQVSGQDYGTIENQQKVEEPSETQYNKDRYYVRVAKKGIEHANTSNTKINAELTNKSEEVILGLYYWDKDPGTADTYQGNALYVQAKTKAGQKKMYFPAPFVAAVQNAKDGQVDFSSISLSDWSLPDQVSKVIASLAKNPVVTDTKASITISIADALDPNNKNNILGLVDGLQGYLDALDLDLDANKLGQVLPGISITLSADLDNGVAKKIDVSLQMTKPNGNKIDIKNATTEQSIIYVGMDKDLDITASLTYEFGKCTTWVGASNLADYTPYENILDAKVSADLYLDSAINMSLLDGSLTLNVPAGYYTLTAEVAANPFAIISMINAENGIDFSSTPLIINSIKKILQAVNALELKLERTKDGAGQAVAADQQVVLDLLLANTYNKNGTKYDLDKSMDGSVAKTINLTTTILGDGSNNLSLENADIDAAITLVNSFIDKSGDKGATQPISAEEAEVVDDTTKLLQTIGGYLLGAYLGINDGQSGHGLIYATFNTASTANKTIPFSGYTKWTGAYNSAYDYYTQTAAGYYTSAGAITEFAEGTKYYTKDKEAGFVPVDQSKGFDNYVYYYTKDSTNYVRQDSLTAFDDEVTYYVWQDESYKEAGEFVADTAYYTYVEATYAKATITGDTFPDSKDYYVKGGTGAKEFGIGLQAELKVDTTSGIYIDATVKNMDIFGLPKSIHARISNLAISLFNNNYPVYISDSGDVTVSTFQTVSGKINGSIY